MGESQNNVEVEEYQLQTKCSATSRAIAWRNAARQMVCALGWTTQDLADHSGLPFRIVKHGLRPDRSGFEKAEHQQAIAQAFADAGILEAFWGTIGGKWQKLWPVEVQEEKPGVLG